MFISFGFGMVESNKNLFIFYYPWYGNPEINDVYRHWNHELIGGDLNVQYSGGDDIGANFYPRVGCYSSNDPQIIKLHMLQIRDAGIDVVSVSWWGDGSFEDKALKLLMDAADDIGLKINIHFEPFYDDISEFKDALNYLNENIGDHPALYKFRSKPLFFVYDSYKTDVLEWEKLLDENNKTSIRHTKLDGHFIGLLMGINDTLSIENSGFDGAYSYFVSDGFTEASTPDNWTILNEWSERNGIIFIPSVGPGYSDTRIRPWNTHNQKDRNKGQYYDKMFASAIVSESKIIAVTSFNEWHEGTQIEPAIPKFNSTFTYSDYGELGAEYYLNRTRYWAGMFHSSLKINLDNYLNETESIHHKLIGHSYIFKNNPHENYNKNSGSALTDGKIGSTQYKDGYWIGFEGDDLIIKFELNSPFEISSLKLRFLHREDAWIFPPKSVEISISNDGNYYESVYAEELPQIISNDGGIKEMDFDFPFYAQYILIKAVNQGVCPEWHLGAGKPAWLFVDEVIVK